VAVGVGDRAAVDDPPGGLARDELKGAGAALAGLVGGDVHAQARHGIAVFVADSYVEGDQRDGEVEGLAFDDMGVVDRRFDPTGGQRNVDLQRGVGVDAVEGEAARVVGGGALPGRHAGGGDGHAGGRPHPAGEPDRVDDPAGD